MPAAIISKNTAGPIMEPSAAAADHDDCAKARRAPNDCQRHPGLRPGGRHHSVPGWTSADHRALRLG